MRKIYTLLFFLCVLAPLFAQKYGNEWVNYNHKYFKFPLVNEGIYRLDSLTLSQGFDLSTLNTSDLKVIVKGKEIRLFVSDGADSKINTNDFVEFYVNPLPAQVDSLVYKKNITYQPNPYRALFNDTIYAFICEEPAQAHLRYTVSNDTTSAGASVSNYVLKDNVYTNFAGFGWYTSNGYNKEDLYLDEISDPNYTQIEARGSIFKKASGVFFQSNPYIYTGNPSLPITFETVFSGNSRQDGTYPDHQVQIQYLDQSSQPVILYDTTFFGYVGWKKTFQLSVGSISPSSSFTISSVSVPSYTFDNLSMVNYMRLRYPMQMNFNAQAALRFTAVAPSGALKNHCQFSNFANFGSGNPIAYDLKNGVRLTTVYPGGSVRILLAAGSGNAECYIAAAGAVISVNKLIPVNANGKFSYYNNSSNQKQLAIVYHNQVASAAQRYIDYRSSITGGNYKVIAANIDHLYEQFAYGVNKHPIAIRNFIQYLNDSLQSPPEAVFLIGKGMKQADLGPGFQNENLIPVAGVPSSDHWYTTALNGTDTYYPQLPIGRLSVLTNSDVSNYLEKVQEFELSPKAEWKKNVLHFVGGDDETLNAKLKQYMDGYTATITDTLFGAAVKTFMKNTTAPIQTEISDTIRRSIDAGCSLMNFFGHGSEQGFDQAIDEPSFYNNAGRYPLIIANSCYSGNIFVNKSISVSERFVNAKRRGSIGFVATTSYGFDAGLDNFTRGFYKALCQTNYGTTIGQVMQEAARLNSLAGDQTTPIVGMEMCLNADPVLNISVGKLPDYQLKNSSISFNTKTYADSIGISIAIKNPYKAVNDSMWVRITRFFPNNDSLVIRKVMLAPKYLDTLKLYNYLDFDRGIGLNRFKVTLDDIRQIPEDDESNNTTLGTVDLFVPGGDIVPVIPARFAIVPKKNTITLKACTSDPFAPLTTYRFQLDTSNKFLSPLSQTLIVSKGGVIEWQVNLTLADSTVYFWRVSRDSISEQKNFAWRESSFQTLSDKIGWGQSKFEQYRDNSYQYVNYDKTLRRFNFRNTKISISTRNAVFPTIGLGANNCFYNTLALDQWSPMFNGWNFVVFDSASAQPWRAIETNTPFPKMGQYGNCCNGDRWVFSFGVYGDCQGSMPNWKADMEAFLNLIPKNTYVLAYNLPYLSPLYANQSSYSNSLLTEFEKFGLAKIRTTPDSLAYAFFGRKGMSIGQAHEEIGTTKKSVVYLFDTLSTVWKNGYVASTTIGPAYKWNSLHWKVFAYDNALGDSTKLKVIGIRANGNRDTLFTLSQDSTDIANLANRINAKVYPRLQLVAMMSDNITKTSPQLKYWRIYYDPVPELAINPLKGFAAVKDSLQEGDLAEFRVPIENISSIDTKDSVVVSYWLEDQNRNKTNLNDRVIAKALKAAEVYIDTIKPNSYRYVGNNQLWMFVNNPSNLRYQAEQESFNNIAKFDFEVSKDNTNPLLDVTFDGIRILNGDIVSSKPEIVVRIKDENKFLALNDTAAFSLWITEPGASQRTRLYFANEQLQFTPAQLPKNSALVSYKPNLSKDGTYMLSVQARDRSSNKAGNTDYAIAFEVDSKPGITEILNYPNPFTSSTRFVFTITGSELPEIFTIQIMTVSGKVVKEITRAELGSLHIGRNITEYAWDGRDMYGDRLANGVYLYRVNIKLNGEKLEHRASGADQFFTKEIGKMVLMR